MHDRNPEPANKPSSLSTIEITALILFSAVMFYLLANVFLHAHKNQVHAPVAPVETPAEDTSITTTLEEVTIDSDSSESKTEAGDGKPAEPIEIETPPADEAIAPEQDTGSSGIMPDSGTALVTESDTQKKEMQNAIEAFCKDIDKKLGSVTIDECLSAKLKHSGSLSTDKQPLAYRDFINGDLSDEKTRILLIGGIHGDEFSGVSISFKWLHNLAKAYAEQTDESIDNLHWRVIPLLNPDGLLQPDGQSHRMNSNDVDLNRNFPTPDWDDLAIKFWKEKRYSDKRRYPGPAAGSEIETQWIVDQVEDFNPHAVISIHAPYGILDADGPIEPPPNVGPLQLKILGTYPGSMGRYIGVYKNLSMLTVELKHAGIMPSRKDIDHIWVDILEWIDDKVVSRNSGQELTDAALQSMRHEINGTTKEIVIDKKAGD